MASSVWATGLAEHEDGALDMERERSDIKGGSCLEERNNNPSETNRRGDDQGVMTKKIKHWQNDSMKPMSCDGVRDSDRKG